MKSCRRSGSGSGRGCSGGQCSWFCTATACSLLFVGLLHRWAASTHVFSHHNSAISQLPICWQCNPDMRSSLERVPPEVSLGGLGSPSKDENIASDGFLAGGEKYLYYAPHSGFNNQVMELKNALMFAKLLNRTLVIPPVLEHHAAWLGSCPKRRVLEPYRLRALAWTQISDLILNSRYVSLADIINLSTISPSRVKTVDLRVFVALWCGVDISVACRGPVCRNFAEEIVVWGALETCIELLNPLPQAEQQCCVYGVEEDCTSTIWTNKVAPHSQRMNGSTELHIQGLLDRSPDAEQKRWTGVAQLKNVRHLRPLTAVAAKKLKDDKAEKKKNIRVLDIVSSLGPHSEVATFHVLAFGSMFSTEYKGAQTHIDIKSPTGIEDLDEMLGDLKLLPFAPDIIAAGKQYVRETIQEPFYCAQVRLLDGQFKNHWEKTFRNLKSQLESNRAKHGQRNPLPLFVMTDLPYENWTGTVLEELREEKTSYNLFKLSGREEIIQNASMGIQRMEHGFKVGYGAGSPKGAIQTLTGMPSEIIPDVVLAVEEVVCSCASLGFFGTAGSMIADTVKDLRAAIIFSN